MFIAMRNTNCPKPHRGEMFRQTKCRSYGANSGSARYFYKHVAPTGLRVAPAELIWAPHAVSGFNYFTNTEALADVFRPV